MSALSKSLRELLGAEPRKPVAAEFTDAAIEMHRKQRGDKSRIAALKEELAEKKLGKAPPEKWRRRRWAVLIVANLLFVVSYKLDIQVLDGALTASRFRRLSISPWRSLAVIDISIFG